METISKTTEPQKEDSDFIPCGLYDKITDCMPIVSVEAVIEIDHALLLLRRKNAPARGQWWLPGGRIRKGESLEDALIREVREETGLEVSFHKLVNVYSRVFIERHDITIVYVCKCKNHKITINSEHSEYRLFQQLPQGLHHFLFKTIQDSGWEQQLVN